MNTSPITNLAPIERQAVSEQVAQKLLSLVQAGSLKPGQQLPPERDLAATLQVSRPSLREALRALSLLGVVRIRQGGGVFVSALEPEALLAPIHFFISLDSRNLQSLFDARILVESGIARIAATRISKAEIETLAACVDIEESELADVNTFIDSDARFHKTIFDAVDNPFLLKIATSLHLLGQASREITGRIPGVVSQSLQDHKRILAAMIARDPDKAAAAMETHLKNVRRAYLANSGGKRRGRKT